MNAQKWPEGLEQKEKLQLMKNSKKFAFH